MRILMLVSWYTHRDSPVLKAGVFHYEQSMSLKKYADVALCYPVDNYDIPGITKGIERELLTYRLVQKNSFMPYRFMECIKQLKRVIEDFKPDIINAHAGELAGVLACIIKRKYNIPVVITEHNPLELSHFEKPHKKALFGYAYSHSDMNICVSGDAMKRTKEVFPKCKFDLIYNGVINPKDMPDDGENYRIDDKTNILITAAFYDKEIKGYQYLIPAIKKLIDKKVPLVLHICGGGDYEEYYKNLAKELGVGDYCIFHGQVAKNQVYSIMRQMDFCISTSIFECSGVSVQEAMLLGKPLVVTRSGGANSLCTENTAIVVDRQSVDAIVDGIEEMIEKRDEFDSAKIYDYAYDNFEIDEVSKRYIKLFEEILDDTF